MALDVYKDWLGIPEGPRPPDHYQLLRLVQFEDDTEKIRKNYKKLNTFVRKYATGQYSNESQVLLNELAKAMLCLTDAEQKLEYDKSLGREIDDRDELTGRRPLTSFLVDDGLMTSEQVKEVKAHSERAGLSIRDALVQLKLVDAETATRALAKELGRSYVDLPDMLPDDSVLDQVPRSVVRRHTCLPLFVDNGAVLVACADDPETELEDEIRLRFNLPVRPVLATPLAINQGIAKYYSAGLRQEAPQPQGTSKPIPTSKKKEASATLTEAEKEQRRQHGMVAMCMSFAGFSLLDTFYLYDHYYKRMGLPEMVPFAGILIGLPLAAFFFLTMVRKK